MSGGILPDMRPRLELVTEDWEPGPVPGMSSIYPDIAGAATRAAAEYTARTGEPVLPVTEYWNWLLQQDRPALARIAAAYATGTPNIGPAEPADPETTASSAQPSGDDAA
jgi:hypothetical protein